MFRWRKTEGSEQGPWFLHYSELDNKRKNKHNPKRLKNTDERSRNIRIEK